MTHFLSGSLYTLGGFVVALGLLVFFHELGHYSVARGCGIRVLRFSIGFGPVLWLRRLGADQTEWALCAIPLGGYVRMLDEREGEVAAHEQHRAFNRQTLGRRAAVVAAGPAANLLLAVLLFALSGMLGMPGLRPFLAAPPAGSPAAASAIADGTLVRRVNGDVPLDWYDLRLRIASVAANADALRLELEAPDGRLREVRLSTDAAAESSSGDPVEALGLQVWNPPVPPRLGQISPDGAAQRQGLQAEDLILSVDGHPVATWLAFVDLVRASPGIPLAITLARQGQVMALSLTPQSADEQGHAIGRIGAAVRIDPALQSRLTVEVRRAPWPALVEGVQRTWALSRMTLTMLGRMLVGRSSAKAIGGPLQIASAAGDSARLGLVPFLGFMALISVSLGVLNLLPVPVLDGGHLLYYSFELISGRPLPDRVVAVGTRIGIALLGGLMALAFYNDFNRFFSG